MNNKENMENTTKAVIGKIISVIILIILLYEAFKQPENDYQVHNMTTFAMDTIIDFSLCFNGDENIFIDVEKEIRRYENMFSTTIEESEVSNINKNSGTEYTNLSDETFEMLEYALSMSYDTKGAFSVTIAPLVDLWGIGKSTENKVPSNEEILNARERINYENLVLDYSKKSALLLEDNMSIDLGGVAKGFIADEITELLRDNNINNGWFSLGGNISVMGNKEDGSNWKIAVRNPLDENDYIGILEVSDKFIVTSGGYQRFFTSDGKDYHHIIDQETGFPAENGLISVTIISKSGIKADILSTALFVMGFDKAVEYWKNDGEIEIIFITDTGNVIATKGASEYFDFENKDNDFIYEVIS